MQSQPFSPGPKGVSHDDDVYCADPRCAYCVAGCGAFSFADTKGIELALTAEVFSQGANPDIKNRTLHLEILNARTMLQLVLGSQL